MVLAFQGLSAFGAVLHVAGSVLIVYGQTTVKVAHCIEESSAASSSWYLPPLPHQPRWRRPDGKWRRQLTGSKSYAAAGWTLFAVGNLMRFVSMRFAAQTVLSGLGSLQFVVIPVASRSLLGIKPQFSTGVGMATVLVGNVLIITNGPPEIAFTLPQLREQWVTGPMRAFLLVLGSLLLGLQLLWRHLHRRRRQAEAERRERMRQVLGPGASGFNMAPAASAETDGLLWDAPGSLMKGAEAGEQEDDTLRTFTAALLFSAVASFIGAWSVLFSKSLTYVVTSAPESLSDPYSWFTMAAFVGTAAYWVRQSNKGLKLYPATLIMPLMQAFWMCMSVLEGMIYFDEMSTLSPRALGALMLGLILAIIGAVAMGLSGYFNEQPQILRMAVSPGSHTQIEMESQPFAGSKPGGLVASKDSGVPPDSDLGESRMVEATGRLDRLSSAVFREGSRPAAVDIIPVLVTESTAGLSVSLGAARSQARTSGSAGSSGSGGGRHCGGSPLRVLTPVDTDCQSPQLQFLSRDNNGAVDFVDKLMGVGSQRQSHARMSNIVWEDSSSAQSVGGGGATSGTVPRRGAHAGGSVDMA